MREITCAQAYREAVIQEMERDPSVFIAGEDVSFGGSFGEYLGIKERFPKRIFDTPISETAIAGLGLGAAAMGLRPILEFGYNDFMMVAMDEIVNQIAKFRYMFGGQHILPLVIHCNCGLYKGSSAQHSQSLEAVFSHIPGLKVAVASTPRDIKGLMTAAIRDDNPVILMQPLRHLGDKGHVSEGEYAIPLGQADIKRTGTDVTIITWGSIVLTALHAADELYKEGIKAEVIDVRTLVPLDKETILESIIKTKKAVIAHEAVKRGGYGAEIAAMIVEDALDYLDAPIIRLGAPSCPVPFSPNLNSAYLVSSRQIKEAVQSII